MTFTKGPWRVVFDELSGKNLITGVGEGGIREQIATTEPLLVESDANARLMATAPDMLAILKEIEEDYGYFGDADNCECGDNGIDTRGKVCEHRRVRAVIARAEGKNED